MYSTRTVKFEEPIELDCDEITDCVEVHSPVCICVATLDKKIIMYSLSYHKVLRVLKGHSCGVRQLLYMANHGGNLISCGFEINARVWQPSNTKGESYLGKLTGHNHPITSMVLLPGLPFVATIDEK